MPLQKVTFVLGGAASGKSAFAEALALSGPEPHHYVATAEAGDAEMAARIERHRARRGAGWRLTEAPRELAQALRRVGAGTVLVDCLTLWISNLLLDEREPMDEIGGVLAALDRLESAVVVSNEVGQGIVPADALSRRFREAQGRVNIRVAEAAGTAVLVAAGLPLVLKGELPREGRGGGELVRP